MVIQSTWPALAFPKLKCFGSIISQKITRNGFFKLRNLLKIVNDLDVTERRKTFFGESDHFWT